MTDESYSYESKAPFNMAIATLYSLRTTLDKIRDVEARIDYPASERQRIKIELVKRYFIDSSPLIADKKIIDKYLWVIKLKPLEVVSISPSSGKRIKKTIYSYELNEELDSCLVDLQLEVQKKKFIMPPSDDMSMIAGRMS